METFISLDRTPETLPTLASENVWSVLDIQNDVKKTARCSKSR